MREADRVEVMASHGHSPLDALTLGVSKSDQVVTVLSPDGTPLVIIGVVSQSLLSDVGTIWLLGCDEALRYRRNFISEVPRVLSILFERYTMLENHVHVDNRVSIVWLKRIGFEMDEPVLFRNSGEYFMRFYMKRCGHV
jgi:hypothetical protein